MQHDERMQKEEGDEIDICSIQKRCRTFENYLDDYLDLIRFITIYLSSIYFVNQAMKLCNRTYSNNTIFNYMNVVNPLNLKMQ